MYKVVFQKSIKTKSKYEAVAVLAQVSGQGAVERDSPKRDTEIL